MMRLRDLKRRRTALITGAALFGIFLVVLAWPRSSSAPVNQTPHQAMMAILPSQPIAGSQVPLAQAESASDFAIPLLPSTSVTDPCTGQDVPLSLLEVWASPEGTEASQRQVGLVYNEGIVLVIESNRTAKELPPASAAPDAGDASEGETTVAVDGHTAWQKELQSGFSCASAPVALAGRAPGDSVQTATAGSSGSEALVGSDVDLASTPVIFSPTTDGVVYWLTSDTSVEIGGPFPGKTLTELANQVVWSPTKS